MTQFADFFFKKVGFSSYVINYIEENLSVIEHRKKGGCSVASALLGAYQLHNGLIPDEFLLRKSFVSYLEYYGNK